MLLRTLSSFSNSSITSTSSSVVLESATYFSSLYIQTYDISNRASSAYMEEQMAAARGLQAQRGLGGRLRHNAHTQEWVDHEPDGGLRSLFGNNATATTGAMSEAGRSFSPASREWDRTG